MAKWFLRFVAWVLVTWLAASISMAQVTNPISARVINYKVTFDDPYDINQVWLFFSPLAINASAANMNLGFSVGTRIFATPNFQVQAGFQSSYGQPLDHSRNTAEKSAMVRWRSGQDRHDRTSLQGNKFIPFMNLELGGQYHLIDRERKSTSRIMLTSKKARVEEFSNVDYITVNSRNRQIYSIRGGGQLYSSTVSLGRPMRRQGLTLTSEGGLKLNPDGSTTAADGLTSITKGNQLFTNLQYAGFYVGGAYTLIKNVAIKADKFGNLANNITVSGYADILAAPAPMLDNLLINKEGGGFETVSTSSMKINKAGFRTGFDVFYNQDLFYAIGGEIGYRPAPRGQRLYVMARFSFPALAFKIKRNRLANQVYGGS